MADPKDQAKPEVTTELSGAVELAKRRIDSSILPRNHFINALDPLSRTRLGEFLLEPEEEVVFVVRQSRLHKLIPALLIFTNRKIAIVQPSIMHLLGIEQLAFNSAKLIPYTKINEFSVRRGAYLRSIFIIIPGSPITELEGIGKADADLAVKFVMGVMEGLER